MSTDLRDSFASDNEAQEMLAANEIMQYIEDQHLTQNAAALHVIRNGVTHLRVSLAIHIAMYIGDATEVEASDIVASLCLATGEPESVQVAYGQCIRSIAKTVAAHWAAMHLASWTLVAAAAERSTSSTVMDAWGTALTEWSIHLLKDEREEQCWPWVERSVASTNPIIRILACRMFVALAKTDGPDIVDALWRSILRLRTDPTTEVALAFLLAMTTIREVGGVAMARAIVVPAILDHSCHACDDVATAVLAELVHCRVAFVAVSPQQRIQCAADDIVADVLAGYFSNEPPVALQIALAEHLGQLLYNGGALKTSDAMTTTVVQYLSRAHLHPNVAFRRWVAFNMPAVLLTFQRDHPSAVQVVLDLHERLSGDSFERVRVTIAASFHEIVKLVPGPRYPKSIDIFHTLISDSSSAVKDRIFVHTPAILQSLLGHKAGGSTEWKTMTKALLPQMAAYSAVASSDWRKLRFLFRLFDSVTAFVTAAEVHATIVPLLLRQLSLGAAVLKRESAQHLANAFATTCSESNKALLVTTLSRIVRLGTAETWQTRVGFVHVATAFCNARFGQRLCTTYFQPLLVKLAASDPIPAVVRAVAAALPELPTNIAAAVKSVLPADATTGGAELCFKDSPSTSQEAASPLMTVGTAVSTAGGVLHADFLCVDQVERTVFGPTPGNANAMRRPTLAVSDSGSGGGNSFNSATGAGGGSAAGAQVRRPSSVAMPSSNAAV